MIRAQPTLSLNVWTRRAARRARDADYAAAAAAVDVRCQHKGTTRIEIEIEKRTHNCALAWRARDNRNWWARGGQFALRTPSTHPMCA